MNALFIAMLLIVSLSGCASSGYGPAIVVAGERLPELELITEKNVRLERKKHYPEPMRKYFCDPRELEGMITLRIFTEGEPILRRDVSNLGVRTGMPREVDAGHRVGNRKWEEEREKEREKAKYLPCPEG